MSKTSKNSLIKESSSLLNIEGIYHAFYTRQGGVSEGEFSSLNCCFKDKDLRSNVLQNLKRICEDAGIDLEHLKLVNQVHSNKAFYVGSKDAESNQEAVDAIVTDKKGLMLGIQTADCTPILFADKKNSVIGAAHAGWKGALNGVIENTIELMVQKDAQIENICAIIGPTIAQKSYEVDSKFKKQFLELRPSSESHFISSEKPTHYMFDLPGFCMKIR